MTTVTVIGGGNVALHLCKALFKSPDIVLQQIYSRNKLTSHFDEIEVDKINNLELIKDSDVYIISVSDDAVIEVAKSLPLKDKLVVHTTGSVTMDDLPPANRKGVFYPLQTFSKSKAVNFKDIPICLEAEFQNDYNILESIATSISNQVYKIDSSQRRSLHLSAVFVNNFVNHLFYVGEQLGKDKNISFSILKPLIEETVDKIKHINTFDSQTGPAKRNDIGTINSHLNQLENYPNFQNIYQILTKSIRETYE
ncbi:Rossmann-like and DUF2520 domain-containing protein [Neptunitalea lumnitzerae]|uniref:DUF2520 domain-containing protein n=1 Tax=Neptunitalea lumnitzerae TaxID=2965509 RepID=A0ABQ5MJG7_9FLAO|nr:DUF2520 domain-containing protein [Neptunitalea sp. Y10]GLB49544.1 hypothetical protein Y10_19120 [Neptunitalea sp. Y10]